MKKVSTSQVFNFTYWDYLFIDLRSKEDYESNRLGKTQHFPSKEVISSDLLLWTPENKEYILIIDYDDKDNEHTIATSNYIEQQLLPFLQKTIYYNNSIEEIRSKMVEIEGGLKALRKDFPFLFIDSPNYNEDIVYPSQILPCLYQSSQLCSSNPLVINNLNIHAILNVTMSAPNVFENDPKFNVVYLNCNIQDNGNENIISLFEPCIKFINQAKEKGHCVLVHCDQGVSRSSALILAYLMFEFRWSFKTALQFLKERRTIAAPNTGFQTQLLIFEESMNESD